MILPRLADLSTVAELARATGFAADAIVRYADAPDQAASYTLLKLKKRGAKRAGQFRLVHKAIDESLAQFHRGVALLVTSGTTFGAHVQGFVGQRSIVTNARQHLGARRVMHGDIQNFFDAIDTAQVRGALISIGTPVELAGLLARACTIDGRLRQGTRCGPALANLVCRQLDADLLLLASAHGAVYTRYADDLTFSGEETPRSEAVQAVLAQHGFALRDGRCSVHTRGSAQYVTGLYVGDPAGPRLPRELKRRLRLILHCVEKFGVDGHFMRPGKSQVADRPVALAGMLRFVQSIEPALAKKLRKQYQNGSRKSYEERKAAGDDYPY